MLQNNNENQNSKPNRYVTLDVRGDVFNILKSIGKQIPFIEVLIDSTELSPDANPNEPIVIEEVSPLFFKILTDFLKNQDNIDNFKKNIIIFDEKNVQQWLKYLGMDKLFKIMYGCKTINGQQVVLDTKILYDTNYDPSRKFVTYTTCDRDYNISCISIDIDNALVIVSAYESSEAVKKTNKENKDYDIIIKGYMVISKDNKENITFFREKDIIKADGLYFITLRNAIKFKIISNSELTVKKMAERNIIL